MSHPDQFLPIKESILHYVSLTLTHCVRQVFEEGIFQEHAEVVKHKGGTWFTRII